MRCESNGLVVASTSASIPSTLQHRKDAFLWHGYVMPMQVCMPQCVVIPAGCVYRVLVLGGRYECCEGSGIVIARLFSCRYRMLC